MWQFLKKSKKNECKLILLFSILFICLMRYTLEDWSNEKEKTIVNSGYKSKIFELTKEDMRVEPQEPMYIDLSVQEKEYIIEETGDYVLSGNMHHTLYIDAEENIVHLFFDGVNIDTKNGAAIHVLSASKLIVTLLDNTENIIIDSSVRSNVEEKAAIMSIADLTINGSGKLSVYGYYEDGIRTKDILKILSGNIVVQSKKDGIRGNDGILLTPEILTIESEGNGLYTANVGNDGKGNIEISGGSLEVIAGGYGMVSQGDLIIQNAVVNGKGVRGLYYIEGQYYIEEGCIENE